MSLDIGKVILDFIKEKVVEPNDKIKLDLVKKTDTN